EHGDERSLHSADPVVRSVGVEAYIPEDTRVEEGDLNVLPVFLVDRPVPPQVAVEEFRLPAELVVGQLVGLVRKRRAVLPDTARVRYVAGRESVEGSGTETLGPGVISQHTRQDVPGQIRAALEALVGRMVVQEVDVGGQFRARCRRSVVAGRNRRVEACATHDGALLNVVV